MQTVVRMGLDIAKSAFQVHGVNAQGKVLLHNALTTGGSPRGIASKLSDGVIGQTDADTT
jgi:hypothetical protein